MVKVAVIGAGVIGLSSALHVKEIVPEAEVVVLADKFPPHTTSDVSGGLWGPRLLLTTPEESIRKWSGKTWLHMLKLVNSNDAKYTGASLVSGFCCSVDPNKPIPFWSKQVYSFRVLSQEELKQFPGMKVGFFYTTAMVETGLYLQWLMKRLQSSGITLKKRFVDNMKELSCEGYDIVVNCTGVGAQKLGDTTVQPIRGQITRVVAPWFKHFVICKEKEDHTLIVPSTNFVVMGGTVGVGDLNTEVSQKDKQKIWDRCIKHVPSLKEAVIDSDHVGLRPSRPAVRLELECQNIDGRSLPIVHNYGHGGAGVTLHWGCAEDAAHLVKRALSNSRTVTSKL